MNHLKQYLHITYYYLNKLQHRHIYNSLYQVMMYKLRYNMIQYHSILNTYKQYDLNHQLQQVFRMELQLDKSLYINS